MPLLAIPDSFAQIFLAQVIYAIDSYIQQVLTLIVPTQANFAPS